MWPCALTCAVCAPSGPESWKPLILKTLLRSCDLLERIAEPKSNSRKDRGFLYLPMGFLQQAPHPISCLSLLFLLSLFLFIFLWLSPVLNTHHHFLWSVSALLSKKKKRVSISLSQVLLVSGRGTALIFPNR